LVDELQVGSIAAVKVPLPLSETVACCQASSVLRLYSSVALAAVAEGTIFSVAVFCHRSAVSSVT